MKIKIAFLIDRIDSPTAGTEKQLIKLVTGLRKDKFSPHLICLQRTKWVEESFSECPVSFLDIDSILSKDGLEKIFNLGRFLNREGFDILQLHFRDSILVGTIASFVCPNIRIVSLRKNLGYWMNLFDPILLSLCNLRASHFIVNSYATQRWLKKTEIIWGKPVEVIYNGVRIVDEAQSEENMRKCCRRKLGLLEDEIGVVSLSNLRQVKRIDLLVEAAKNICNENPRIKFFLAGEGPENEKLKNLAGDYLLSGKICFLGNVVDTDDLLCGMDIGVLTSDSESFSNALIEFLNMGLPAITTDVGGCPEAIIEGKTGLVIPKGDLRALGNAIRVLVSDPILRMEMGRKAKVDVAKRFSERAYLARYERSYQTLLDDSELEI